MLITNYTNYSGQAICSNAEPFAPRSSLISAEKVNSESREAIVGSAFVTDSLVAKQALFKTVDASREIPSSLGAGTMFNERVPGFAFPLGLRDRLSQVFRWPTDVEEVLGTYFEEERGLGAKLMYWVQAARFDYIIISSLLSGNGTRWRSHLYEHMLKSMLRVNGMDNEFNLSVDKCTRPNFGSESDVSEAKIYSEWLKTLASAPHLLSNKSSTLSFLKRGDPKVTPILCDYYSRDVVHENGISPTLELTGACSLTYAMNKYPDVEHSVLAINNEGPRVNVTWMWSTVEGVLHKQWIGQFNVVEALDWYRYCVFVSRLSNYLQQEAGKYNVAMRTVGQKRARALQYKAPSMLLAPVYEEPVSFTWNSTPTRGLFRFKRQRFF